MMETEVYISILTIKVISTDILDSSSRGRAFLYDYRYRVLELLLGISFSQMDCYGRKA
jgi:hypothetical protein